MVIYYLFLFSLLNISFSLKLNVNKNKNTYYNKKNSSLKIRNLKNDINFTNYSSVDLSLFKYENGLYSIDIYIGEPKQKFSLVIDSGSSILWVYDKKCTSCKSKNKFITSNSKTYISNNEIIYLNYVTGRLTGKLCQDNMYFKDNFNMPLFYFLLIFDSNLDFEIDGIIGLSKGTHDRKKYSFLNQLNEKKIIKENYYIYDLFNKLFYIAEIPSYLNKEKKVTCFDNDEFSTFWKCEINSIKINNISIFTENKIIFDSGTNGIVFPIKYLNIFKNIIENNFFLTKNKCYFENDDDDIYYLYCNETIDFENNNITDIFIEFYLESKLNNKNNSNNDSFGINLSDLLNEDEKSFSLYVFDRKDEILLGAPFFEKYPIMFNKDNNIVTIFGKGNNLYKYHKSKNNKNKIIKFLIITIIIISFILIIMILRQLYFSKRRINNKQIDALSEENQ